MPSEFKETKTPLLEAIVFPQDSPVYQKAEQKIRQGLLNATLMHRPTLEATVRHFSRFAPASDSDWLPNVDGEELPTAVGALFRYPKEVDALVSKALRDWMFCTCSTEAKQAFQNKHLAQLRYAMASFRTSPRAWPSTFRDAVFVCSGLQQTSFESLAER
jgi:hypothetical protein